MSKKVSLESLCVKQYKDSKTTQPHQLPIYATSSFAFDNVEDSIDIFEGKKTGHVYSRYGNPTIDTVGQKIADLETWGTGLEGYGYMTSSGMSAITTIMASVLKSGNTILTQRDLYGGTMELFLSFFNNMGINTIFEDLNDTDAIEHILQSNWSVKAIYFETPSNPTLKCIDIAAIAKVAKKYGVWTIVDNTFCTPVLQRPLSLGVDFVIHSTTKYLNGHGNSIAGAIVGYKKDIQKKIWTTLKLTGATCNPWDAWLVNNGLKTLPLRMERHSENAMALATFLKNHPKVKKVNYNGLTSDPYHKLASKQMKYYGGMLSFEIDAPKETVLKTINHLELCTIAPTLGDIDTLILHPATSSHLNVDKRTREEAGITDQLVRVSVGIENIEDIIADFERALK